MTMLHADKPSLELMHPAESHSDVLLQASRRLDWRFLLPDPGLDRVAYIGPIHGTLLPTLRQFSKSDVLEAPDADDAGYDVVVLRNPSLNRLRSAVRLVRPGGCLYAEISGAGRLPGRYVTTLRRAGLTQVEMYWHWPNFEKCTRIIPLGGPTPLVYTLIKGQTGVVPQFWAILLHWLHQTGLLHLALWHFSLVAQREDA